MMPIARPILTVMLLSLCQAVVEASRRPPPPLNPKTYASPSGQYRLFVDPSHIHGQGPATYRLTLGDAVAWSATLSYTLVDATLADDGTVIGYAYSHGYGDFAAPGDLVIAILAPDGKPRLEQRLPRQPSLMLEADPVPFVTGMLIDPQADRLIVRAIGAPDSFDEQWHVFSLSTGQVGPVLHPRRSVGPDARHITGVRPIPGTGLTLVQWWLSEGPTSGTRFTLHDTAAECVWSLDLPHDYEGLRQPGTSQPGILDASQPNRFTVLFVQANQRVTFDVRRDAGAAGLLKVAEVAREPFVVPAPAPAPRPPSTAPVATAAPAIPKIDLRLLGSLTFGSAPTSQPVRRHIRDLQVDDRGRLGFVRYGPDGPTVVIVPPDDTPPREYPVRLFSGRDVDKVALAPVRGDRWLVTSSDGASTRGWWLDAATGKAEALDAFFESPPIVHAAGTPDGGFVALTSLHRNNTIEEAVLCFNDHGRLRWRIDASTAPESNIFSPENLTVTRDGKVALIDNIRHRVDLFSPDGRHLRTLHLDTIFGRKANYPTGVSADTDGGLVVHDFNADPPLWRLTRAGEIRARFHPRFADGRPVRNLGPPRVTPDGGLWITDGDTLLRLHPDTGVVDRVLGELPRPSALTAISAATVDRAAGRIYAVASRTAAVHVFDRDGRPLFVCTPDPANYPSNARPTLVTVDKDGNIYVDATDPAGGGAPRYVRYDPTGRRTGLVPAAEDSFRAAWTFRPGTADRWVCGMSDVSLVAHDGRTLRTISRHADRTWLDNVDLIAVAPDGALAVATDSVTADDPRPAAVSLYTPGGDPVRTLRLPDGPIFAMAYDGARVITSSTDGLRVTRAGTGQTATFTPPSRSADRPVWVPLLGLAPDELWIFARESNRIERYALP